MHKVKVIYLVFIIGLAMSTFLPVIVQGNDTQSKIEQKEGIISISARDITTGYALPALISISKVKQDGSTGTVIDSFQLSLGEIVKSYPIGKYNIELKMDGYKLMKSWFVIEAGKKFRDRYIFSPIESKKRAKLREKREIAIPFNMAVISGYITDDETGEPLEGVRIVFENKGIEIYTDQKGYYEASVPAEESIRFNDEEINALQETIVFSLTGYQTRKELNVLIIANQPLGKNMIMFKGVGEIIEDRTPKFLLPRKKLEEMEKLKKNLIVPLQREELSGDDIRQFSKSNKDLTSAKDLLVKKPPESIKVGFSSPTWEKCCSTSSYKCPYSQTYGLEDYVLKGVCNEWYPSWKVKPHSIRAGTVAYRSYGAYHIVHPNNHSGPNYDICAGPCCQAFDPTEEISLNKTAGIMLQKNGGIFFPNIHQRIIVYNTPTTPRIVLTMFIPVAAMRILAVAMGM